MAKIINARLRDAPSLKDFSNHVRKAIAPEWYDFGVQLDISPDKLDLIKAGHTDPLKCCTEVFKQWCQKNENVTWKTLIEALESPSLERLDLAHNIRQNLISDADETEHQDVIVPTRNIEEFQSPALKSPPSNIPDRQSSKAEHQVATVPTRILEDLQSAVPKSIPDCDPSTEVKQNTTSSTPNSLDNTTESIDYSSARSLPPVEAIPSSLSLTKPDIQEVVTCSPMKKEKHDDKVLSGMLTSPMDIEICLPDGKVVRKYQKELATPGMEGRNCIVVAPTGTGKTLVACMIISAQLKHSKNGKVVFLANTTPLALQQKQKLESQIKGVKVAKLTGESSSSFALSTILKKNDVVVCTPQVLLNDLADNNTHLEEISLLVFDECHRCKGQSPYAAVMLEYLKKKLRKGETQLPQIVGLTASPGAGDSRKPDLGKTIDHLIKLGALLDADGGYVTVKENKMELQKFTNKTEVTVVPMSGRISDDDDFQDLLFKYIKLLDKIVQDVTGKSTSHCFTHQGYINFLSECLQESKLRPGEDERSIRSIIEHLKYYTKILHYYSDYDFEDALSMRQKLRNPDPDKIIPVEKQLMRLLQDFEKEALHVSGTTNPKLQQLKQLLLDSFRHQADTKAMIFVTEVESACKMRDWIKRQPDLGCIQAGTVIGHGHDSGMSQVQQNYNVKCFREGQLNLLVATSVLEEGIDVPACNLVIRYQHVTNEISLVQSKGRARAADSKCYAIIGKGTPKEFQELQNEEKSYIANHAMEHCLPPRADWLPKMRETQKKLVSMVELEEKYGAMRKNANVGGTVDLLCSTCDSFVCHATEVYVNQGQYVVISDDINERFVAKKHEKPRIKSDVHIEQRMHCKECDQRWGVVTHWPKKRLTLPCLSCEKLAFVIKGEKRFFKKWKDATFSVKDIAEYVSEDV